MATTTPNFGWTVPTSTDLVKDGATAIETLGDGIDASFVDLKGGTTGQVLSKASGTDLDFTWVAQDDSNAIQNAIVDAKGDLIAATAADTPARLAVGTNGQVLTADSTAATGVAWATPASGGGMTLLSTITLSGTSTTISSISQSYKNLFIVISGVTSSANQMVLRIAPNGTTNATDYAMFRSVGGSASVVASSAGYIDTYSAVQYDSAVNAFTLELTNYASSTYRKSYNFYGGFRQSDPSDFSFGQSGIFKSTTAISSLVFSTSANSFTAGQVLVYGVN